MSRNPSLSDRLASGSPVLSAWCGLPDPSIAGLLAREAFGAVTIDMQHGAMDLAAAVRAIPLVAAAGKPALVRVPVGEFATVSRVLDAGASGVIAPMINTVEDARRLARAAKFPPAGERSWGPHGALAVTGLEPPEYFAAANGFHMTLAMIETREALDIVDDILAVPGIDGIFIGPSDLSIGLSQGREVDPASAAVETAIDHALDRARAAGKAAAIYAVSGERAAAFVRKGFHLVAVASDTALLRTGARMVLQAAGG